MSRRTDMLGSTIQRELATMILHDLDDPRLEGAMASITRVKVSSDLAVAEVFVTIMGTPGAQEAALNALKHSAGMMRMKLTKSLSLRVAPFIKFHLDDQLRKELDVLNLLSKVTREDAERHQTDEPPEGETSADESAADDESPADESPAAEIAPVPGLASGVRSELTDQPEENKSE